MATRNRSNEEKPTKRQQDNARAQIAKRSTELVKALMGHVVDGKEMSATQIRAAEILLRKALPDLSAIEHEGETTQTHYHITDKPLSEDEWESRYSPDLATTEGTTESPH